MRLAAGNENENDGDGDESGSSGGCDDPASPEASAASRSRAGTRA
jgi:hypothetical protein